MKRKHISLAALSAALLIFGLSPANALTDAQVKAIRKATIDVPALELAPKAAAIVQKASEKDRPDVAVAVVRIVLSKKPALASTVVEAIAEVAPETSAAIAALAAELCPAQAQEIARIAASYAPEQATRIAADVAKAAPKDALNITRRVVGAVPELSDKVTEAVIAVVPSSKPEIQNDATLTVVSSIARNTGSSASLPVRKFIGRRPNPNPPSAPPTQIQNLLPQARSQAANDAVKAIESTAVTAKLDTASQASLITETVKAINAVVKPSSGLDKKAQESLIAQVSSTVIQVVSSSPASKSDRVDLATGAVQAVKTVVLDTTLKPEEKQALVTFTQTQVTTVATDKNATAKTEALHAAIQSLVTAVKQVSEIAKTTHDVNAIQAQLDISAREIAEKVKAYAKP